MVDTHHSSVPPSKAGEGDHDNTGTFPGMKQPRWKVRQASMVGGIQPHRHSSCLGQSRKAHQQSSCTTLGLWDLFFSVSVSEKWSRHFLELSVKQARCGRRLHRVWHAFSPPYTSALCRISEQELRLAFCCRHSELPGH